VYTEQRLVEQLLESLRNLPGVYAEPDHAKPDRPAPDRGYDFQINLRIADRAVTLLLEAKRTVYPRDARQLLWQLSELNRRAQPQPDHETQSLLIAESISPGAKELLRAERVGYFDSGGSLFLPAPGAYLYIDRPPPKPLQKSIRSLFSGSRSQVLHALLVHYQDWFGVKEIAAQAQVASSTASEVLSELDRFDWLVTRGQGPSKERHLQEPAALLNAWVKQLPSLRPPDMRRYYVPGQKSDALIEHIGRVFDAHRVIYAVSYEAAAQRYTPFLSTVSQVRVRMLSGPGGNAVIADLGARLVDEGSNLAIIETKSTGELLFRENIGGIWSASPVQVYLDLLRSEGRAQEVADHLRKERIGF
jgi:hypothetical protein